MKPGLQTGPWEQWGKRKQYEPDDEIIIEDIENKKEEKDNARSRKSSQNGLRRRTLRLE